MKYTEEKKQKKKKSKYKRIAGKKVIKTKGGLDVQLRQKEKEEEGDRSRK